MHSCANFWAKLGSYAVLSRISILADLRVFCANFGSEKMGLCYFLHFLHVWHKVMAKCTQEFPDVIIEHPRAVPINIM